MATVGENMKKVSPSSEGDEISPSSTHLPSRENSGSSTTILGLLDTTGASLITEVFMLNYRGSSEVDRHYTKAMLPWIIAEIKNQRKYEKVKVEISRGMVTVQRLASEAPLFSHSIKQIHKCVMEQADHTHFLYTLKPNVDKDWSAKQEAGSDGNQQPVPCNTNTSTDHQCHLFKADSEEYVRSFFKCLRQQPRDSHQIFRSNSQLSMQSLPENFLHGETQFYEVLFVGRVKVSHCKVPASFIDEACAAFKSKQLARSESTSSTENVPRDVTDFQKAGSGHSVPNMTLSGEQALLRSNLRDQKGESRKKSLIQQQSLGGGPPPHQHRVRFTLDTDIDQHLNAAEVDTAPEVKTTLSKSSSSVGTPSELTLHSPGLSQSGSEMSSIGSCSSKEFTPIEEIASTGDSEGGEVEEEIESGELVRTISFRVPEKVNWYLPSEQDQGKSEDADKSRNARLPENLDSSASVESAKADFSSVNVQGNIQALSNEMIQLKRKGSAPSRLQETSEQVTLLKSEGGLSGEKVDHGLPSKLKKAMKSEATELKITEDLPEAAVGDMTDLEIKEVFKKPVSPLALPPPSLPPDIDCASAPSEPSSPRSEGDDDAAADEEARPSFEQLMKRRYSEQLQGTEAPVSAKILFTAFGRSSAAADASDAGNNEELPRQRLRTISGSNSALKLSKSQFTEMRERAGSFGSAMTRPRTMRLVSESEIKVSGAEFNRSMLFHVGREELQLINPELKTVQLRKSFKDIPQRCQGILNNDHFGFICREVAGEVPVYVGYIFRCDNPEVTKDIVQSLNRAFEAVLSAHQKEKQESSLCETCPIRWFSSLCSELEGMAASKAHSLILRRVQQLPEADRELLLAKYEGAEAPEVQRKNNVLMMLLRAHMEALQQTHVHTRPTGGSTGAKGVESSLHRVKKSLATSFQSMLKRDGVSSERESTSKPASEHVRMENVSDSPLGKSTTPHRPRSSTVSTAGGDTMRREFRARLQKPPPNSRGVLTPNQQQALEPPQVEKSVQDEKSLAKPAVVGVSKPQEPVTTLAEQTSLMPDKENPKDFELRSLSPEMEALGISQEQDEAFKPKQGPVKMSKMVAKEVYGGPAQDEDEEKENIPENRPDRPKMNIFLKVGSPSGAMFADRPPAGDDDDDDDDEAPAKPPTSPASFRHVILQRVISPIKSEEGEQDDDEDDDKGGADEARQPQRRTWRQLQVVWRRAVFRQILLCRMEREIRTRRELEEELELQRVCLSYDEEPLEEEALHTWRLVLSRPGARIDHCILRAGVRHGVPKALRGDIWHLLMIQPRPSLRLPVVPDSFRQPYQHMIKGLTSQQHAILIDLGRTFPQHPYFTRTLGPGQLGLFNLLKAYSLLDSEVGYCQGLSFVAGILLMHVNEETAYELLKHLMYVAGVRRQFRQDLDGLQVQMYQLSRLLHDKVVRVYQHFEKNEISPQLYAAPWFLTLFASTFPLHFVVRLYDLLFLEGLEAVFRICLVLLQEHEENIVACDGFEETMRYLKQDLPQVSLENVSRLFDAAFELNLSDELAAYEVEYQVLREELCVTPQRQQHSISKLRQERRALKRQNLDLAEQLQNTQAQKRALESSNQLLQQSQHHLEVRVRFLEVERGNLKQLVEQLWRSGVARDPDFAASVAPGLLRYLPSHSNSPQPLDRSELYKSNPDGAVSRPCFGARTPETSRRTSESFRSPDRNVHVDVATLLGSNVSSSGKPGERLTPSGLKTASPERGSLMSRKSPSPDIGLFGSRASRSTSQQNSPQVQPKAVTSQTPSKTKGEGESIFPPFNIQSYFTRDTGDSSGTAAGHRPRSSTMDHGSMQRFVKGLTRNN